MHWADEATLDLLRFLGRRIRGTRALILVTYRDDGLAADDELRIAVGEVSTQRSTRRMGLPPLSEAAVAALADGTGVRTGRAAPGHRRQPVLRQRGPADERRGRSPRPSATPCSPGVVGLGREARRVLEVASLVGGRMEPSCLVDGDRGSADDDRRARGRAASWSATAAGCGSGTRSRGWPCRRRSRRTARPRRTGGSSTYLLCRTGCDDEARLAHHAEGAGDRAAVLEHAPAAGRRASELGSHREAAVQFQRAVDARRGSRRTAS